MRKLKKVTAAVLVLLFVFSCLAPMAVLAAEDDEYRVVLDKPNNSYDNRVSSISIDVKIREDGSAWVTQSWQGVFYNGTENYIPIRTGDISISNFRVRDEVGEYEFVEDWDIDADFDEKKRKCGIVETKDGVELCFGISEYTNKRYSISYLVKEFIKGYEDYDGTNFMFVNPDMNTFPTKVMIDIRMEDGTELNDTNAAVWAFGFEGTVEFRRDGIISVDSTRDLEGSNCAIVMLQLDKGLVSPATNLKKSFVEVIERAMEDSDYGHGGDDGDARGVLIAVGAVFGGAAALIITAAVIDQKRKKKIKEFGDTVGYFTEVPNGGRIEVTHYLAQTFGLAGDENLIIGALLLSMMNDRYIDIHTDFAADGEEVTVLELLREPEDPTRQKLFRMLAGAAGGKECLQETVWKDFSYEHYKYVSQFVSKVKKHGEEIFQNAIGGFVKKPGNSMEHLSEFGKAELGQVLGFKKYLEENVHMADKSIWEANLWQEYMVYATLFGIADTVIGQLKELFPERAPEVDYYYYHQYHYCNGYYHHMHESVERAEADARAEGDGGSTSIGGGGGFSGGGSGGGSR